MTVDFGALMAQMGDSLTVTIPIGDYDAFVSEASAVQSQNGKPMIKIKFVIESGPQAGRGLTNNFTITTDNPNALRYFFQHMSAMGLNAAYFATGPSMEAVANALTNQRCRIKVGQHMYNEQWQNDVKAVLPPIGGAGAIPTGVGGGAIPGGAPPITAAPPLAQSAYAPPPQEVQPGPPFNGYTGPQGQQVAPVPGPPPPQQPQQPQYQPPPEAQQPPPPQQPAPQQPAPQYQPPPPPQQNIAPPPAQQQQQPQYAPPPAQPAPQYQQPQGQPQQPIPGSPPPPVNF
jgi:hypothetical protein